MADLLADRAEVEETLFHLNASEISLLYLDSIKDQHGFNDTRNAIVRYFVPSIGGPVPTAKRRRPLASQEVDAAFEALKTIPLQQLQDSPDWALKQLTILEAAPAQRERVRRNLRDLVDWAIDQQLLPQRLTTIPQNICEQIKIGIYADLSLHPATSREIVERYLEQITKPKLRSDTRNAVIRYFVPGCGGPAVFHKPALQAEIDAAFKALETIPLEYLNEAPSIATQALNALGLTLSQGTRVRSVLKILLQWAREQKYLPDPYQVAPWGGGVNNLPAPKKGELPKTRTHITLRNAYDQYCIYLESAGRKSEIKLLKSCINRYLVPALGGNSAKGKRATSKEIEKSLSFLNTLDIERLQDFEHLMPLLLKEMGDISKKSSYISRIRKWQEWIEAQNGLKLVSEENKDVVFNTFYKRGENKECKKPGKKRYEKMAPVHTLCAKRFPDDYINAYLKDQIDEYYQWRRGEDVSLGGVKIEKDQILQVMGWLHRYENAPLEDLCFEKMISYVQLKFKISDYTNCSDNSGYIQYLVAKEAGLAQAQEMADCDMDRMERYLDFCGGSPSSKQRRIFIVLTMAKFLYRHLTNIEEFSEPSDIPVIRRLLKLQRKYSKKKKITAQSVSFHETSVSWEEAVYTMEMQRLRAEQVVVYCRSKSVKKGYSETLRNDAPLAYELQRFLSIAFSLLVPSRSRTFYDLRIGETFLEGILLNNQFVPASVLRQQKDWENLRSKVRFYINHQPEDYKSGKAMPRVLLENGGWWAEIPNIDFQGQCLYDYIYRWLEWGRCIHGTPAHNNFFCRTNNYNEILDSGDWGTRIKNIFRFWTDVPVCPSSIRKMFSIAFPEYSESASMLLQHSEKMHMFEYDMRHCLNKVKPVMQANQRFIDSALDHIRNEGGTQLRSRESTSGQERHNAILGE
jgi:hypothetical protein